MTTQLGRLRLARLQLERLRQRPAARGPEEARLQVLTAELPEARAIERIDREPTPRALTIHVIVDHDA